MLRNLLIVNGGLLALFSLLPYEARGPIEFPPNKAIPVSPNNGGRSINGGALRAGDIIVTSTKNLLSPIIRQKSGAEVSHAILFIGDDHVIEAIGEGVVVRKLNESLLDAKVAVAFRHPAITTDKAGQIKDFALSKLGSKFNRWGLILHPRFGISAQVCSSIPSGGKASCEKWLGSVILDLVGKDQFFCSQLVFLSYKQAGIQIANWEATLSAPGDIPTLSLIGDLQYIGHLKTR